MEEDLERHLEEDQAGSTFLSVGDIEPKICKVIMCNLLYKCMTRRLTFSILSTFS